MTSQFIVPYRPGPLLDVPSEEPAASPPDVRPIGCLPEFVLALVGAALLAAVLLVGVPGWLSVVAVACLALGLALPAQAAFLRSLRRRAGRRRQEALDRGTLLDVSDPAVRRLVTAYQRLDRTAGPGMARDAGHLALAEVAALLSGHAPDEEQRQYVTRRAEAVSALADRLAEGPVMPVELVDADSLTRITALLA